jgi:hypothetical protein
MTYLVTSYPPAKDGALKLIQADEHAPLDLSPACSPDPLATAVTDAENKVLAGHTSVRVWKLHGSPELIQVVKWNQDQGDSL